MPSSCALKRASIALPRDRALPPGDMLQHRRAEYEVELAVGEWQPAIADERHKVIPVRGGAGRGGLHIHIGQTDVPAVGDDGVDMSAVL
jgi:predicted oxidoreductase